MEIGQMGIGNKTFEEELGVRGLKKAGRRKWEKRVDAALERFASALLLDDVVLGGGNAKKLTKLPRGCRIGNNANAFAGGFRMWQEAKTRFSNADKKMSA
jgi:polyphosphate glucokinase